MALDMGVGGFTQGADRVIYDRIADGEENKLKDITWDHLEKFGVDGLRTLCLADCDLDPQLCETWNELYNQAKSTLCNQKEKTDAVRDFPLFGIFNQIPHFTLCIL
jgi:hypothetical protein